MRIAVVVCLWTCLTGCGGSGSSFVDPEVVREIELTDWREAGRSRIPMEVSIVGAEPCTLEEAPLPPREGECARPWEPIHAVAVDVVEGWRAEAATGTRQVLVVQSSVVGSGDWTSFWPGRTGFVVAAPFERAPQATCDLSRALFLVREDDLGRESGVATDEEIRAALDEAPEPGALEPVPVEILSTAQPVEERLDQPGLWCGDARVE